MGSIVELTQGNIIELNQGNLEGLKKQVCECIEHAQAQGFKRGYRKGKNDERAQECHTQMEYDKTKIDEAKQEGYNEGYNTAVNDYSAIIECVHNCPLAFRDFLAECGFDFDIRTTATNTFEIFYNVICSWGALEVVDGFKKWQEQKKQEEEKIKVGDIVVWEDDVDTKDYPFIITQFKNQTYTAMNKEGDFGYFTCDAKFKKIGSASDKLQTITDKLREDLK